MRYKLDKASHAVFLLQYHLVLSIKYRRKALCDETVRERLKSKHGERRNGKTSA
jgi:REP element-mobilizing transposase RayT